jgi:hypothetical protein
MSRGRILWRGLLVAILAIAVAVVALLVIMMNEILNTSTRYVATIRVDGREYTSNVVGRVRFSVIDDRPTPGPYGRVMTFRLPDNRVVVLGTRMATRLQCVPRSDKSDTRCKSRWSPYSKTQHLAPDGYIFDGATNPTSVEAFQFEPKHPDFVDSGQYRQGPGYPPIPISRLTIEMVSYRRNPSKWSGPRDDLDQNFPGYDLTHFRNEKPIEDNNALTNAANDIGIPLRRER